MLSIDISGYKKLILKFLVLDYNGTLATNGKLKNGVKEKVNLLSEKLDISVVTGDTFGTALKYLKDLNCKLVVAPNRNQKTFKMEYVESLGKEGVVSIGNGRNDALMLKVSCLGISILGDEGLSKEALLESDIMVKDILDAFDLLLYPTKLIASLRG